MGLLSWLKRRPVVITSEESEPYAFEPGRVYVIEFNLADSNVDDMRELKLFLESHGINVKLVPIMNKRILYPVSVKRTIQKDIQ